jgi:hypothetical protein
MSDTARCHDCGANPGEPHADGCDVARCLVTGRQRLSCSTIIFPPGADPDRALPAGDFEFGDAHPGEDCGHDVWTGQWPGDAECREYGFWSRFTDQGWVQCSPGHPDATEDLNRLVTECRWDRGQRRWVRRTPETESETTQ